MGVSATAVRLVRNTLANGVGGLAGILLGLVLTPLMIHRLGLETYGVWALALTLTFAGGYASLSELGLEGATLRYVAEASADGDLDGLNRVVCTSLAVLCAIAIVLALAAVALAHPLVMLFGVPASLRGAATACFVIVGAQLVFELPARALVAVLEGTQNFVVFQSVELARGLAQAALYVLVLLAGWGIVGMAVVLAASSLTTLLAYWVFAHRAVAGLRANPLAASRIEISRLVRFGGGLFSLRVLSTIYNQMDTAIIGIALGTRPVALYEIANKISLGAATVASVSVSALTPAAAALRNEAALVRDMFVRGTCYATAAALPFALAILIFAKPLLLTWIGPRALPAAGAVRLFASYEAMQMVNNVGSTMIYGIGRIRFPLIVTAVVTLLNLGLSITLVRPLGFEGVIVGTLLANGLAWPVMVWYYLRAFDCSLQVWLRRVVAPNLPGIAVQVGLSLALYTIVGQHTRSFAVVIVLLAVSVGASLATFVLIGMPGVERRVFLDTVLRAVGLRASADAGLPG
ncbi:MAG TPA: oligosaccharide flippase family protein [Solirubrobacteraceae bacterium]|nr:oligosaccharide flippase family protein [Solirubrobacteraceae bacterium]